MMMMMMSEESRVAAGTAPGTKATRPTGCSQGWTKKLRLECFAVAWLRVLYRARGIADHVFQFRSSIQCHCGAARAALVSIACALTLFASQLRAVRGTVD